MKISFFAVPALGHAEAEAEVNRFLGAHRVVSLDRQLVSDGRGAYWALAVTYLEGAAEPAVLRRGKIDYREVLSEGDFAVYSRLRALRKAIAERETLPPYALFTNEQLAAMVVERVRSTAELGSIAGVGPARIERFGADFPPCCGSRTRASHPRRGALAAMAAVAAMTERPLVRIEEVAAFESLAAAFWRAARGKRRRDEVRAFEAGLDRELATLSTEILAGTVEVGRLRSFEIRDPKPRTIHAPCFRERVLHHALMAHVGPILERALVADTFACREGRGTLAAVHRAQQHARRFPFVAKLDVRSYFASIDHGILTEQLRRRLAGARTLALLDRIVASHEAAPGRGLPIGSLCSQHFANLYLAALDRAVLDRRLGLVRVMDDVLLFGRSAADVQEGAAALIDLARDRLRLELSVVRVPERSARGVPFCGFRVLPDRLLLSRRRRRRSARARLRAESAFALGLIDAAALQRAGDAALAIAAHADAGRWHRSDLARRPPPDA